MNFLLSFASIILLAPPLNGPRVIELIIAIDQPHLVRKLLPDAFASLVFLEKPKKTATNGWVSLATTRPITTKRPIAGYSIMDGNWIPFSTGLGCQGR